MFLSRPVLLVRMGTFVAYFVWVLFLCRSYIGIVYPNVMEAQTWEDVWCNLSSSYKHGCRQPQPLSSSPTSWTAWTPLGILGTWLLFLMTYLFCDAYVWTIQTVVSWSQAIRTSPFLHGIYAGMDICFLVTQLFVYAVSQRNAHNEEQESSRKSIFSVSSVSSLTPFRWSLLFRPKEAEIFWCFFYWTLLVLSWSALDRWRQIARFVHRATPASIPAPTPKQKKWNSDIKDTQTFQSRKIVHVVRWDRWVPPPKSINPSCLSFPPRKSSSRILWYVTLGAWVSFGISLVSFACVFF